MSPSGALPSVTVVVVTRGRPGPLARCLTGLMQVRHPAAEVLVVGDAAGLAVAAGFPVRCLPFDAPNIAAARNAGISAAAGDVVAFLDDDAVPEPLWLARLTAPFAAPEVMAAGGAVLGTNGISLQWAGGAVDPALRLLPLPAPEAPGLYRAAPGRAIEVKGTNCAYRRAALLALGGFDPALRYYLDETELNLRLARQSPLVAFLPGARVWHDKAAAPYRRADRVPRDLTDVGRSSAVTLRRGGLPGAAWGEAQDRLRAIEVAKVESHRRAGRLTMTEATALLGGWDRGFAEGRALPLAALAPLADAGAALAAFPPRPAGPQLALAGWCWQARRLRARAAAHAAAGGTVTLMLWSPTPHRQRRRFTRAGVWEQTGGLFGKSDRNDPAFRFWTFAGRLAREQSREEGGFPQDAALSPQVRQRELRTGDCACSRDSEGESPPAPNPSLARNRAEA